MREDWIRSTCGTAMNATGASTCRPIGGFFCAGVLDAGVEDSTGQCGAAG